MSILFWVSIYFRYFFLGRPPLLFDAKHRSRVRPLIISCISVFWISAHKASCQWNTQHSSIMTPLSIRNVSMLAFFNRVWWISAMDKKARGKRLKALSQVPLSHTSFGIAVHMHGHITNLFLCISYHPLWFAEEEPLWLLCATSQFFYSLHFVGLFLPSPENCPTKSVVTINIAFFLAAIHTLRPQECTPFSPVTDGTH